MGPEELPSLVDPDYQHTPGPDPPVLATTFKDYFYGCKKACTKFRLDILRIFHECNDRSHCGNYRILERLPKCRNQWQIDCDYEKDEAWGLHVVFSISFCMVMIHHTWILIGPLTFWSMWLKRWPTDWQNASVLFFAVLVLPSLFWFPLTHGSRTAFRNGILKDKSQ